MPYLVFQLAVADDSCCFLTRCRALVFLRYGLRRNLAAWPL